MQKKIALVTLIIALTLVNWSIYQKEDLLAQGKIVYLKLAPVDPRSLMQGDYMILRFELANDIEIALKKRAKLTESRHDKSSIDSEVNVKLDERSIASFISLSPIESKHDAIHSKESQVSSEIKTIPLQFRLRRGRVIFATDAYFFEEGQGEVLTNAVYGQFRVSQQGELLLVSLHDNELKKLG